ncbi:hypothetical protein ILYODFUR_022741 [Ilyodon furcidens]|uniref:Uncharacterized protein n=1 Tax=Ilyodon furcidens TaxID=33524 RepID=A0ABV0V7H4_9TELE
MQRRMVGSDTDVTLIFEIGFNFFGGSWLFGYHSYYISLQFVIILPPAATAREIVNLKPFINMFNCSHRNIMLLGDGLIAFTFNMLVYNFLSNLLRQLSPSLPVVHVQCDTHHVTNHHSDHLSPFKIGRLTDYEFEDTCNGN